MSKRKTTEQFVQEAQLVHGNRYDYSMTSYIDAHSKVSIVCNIHGEFKQEAVEHLRGHGCPKCKSQSKKKRMKGDYINDFSGTIMKGDGKKMIPSYTQWRAMITRCENEKYQEKYPTYKGCKICKEWHRFSIFKEWFDRHYVDGWQLDKDILFKGNKLYSPNTCCFVPSEINNIFKQKGNPNRYLPTGVIKNKNNTFVAYISINGKSKQRIGLYNTIADASNAHKQAKAQYIKNKAEKYKNELNPNVYNTLINYKIE